ncbi:hypothetical protein Glove_9g341 [Diversispora epigaea]|uniref:Uncharacterized protein n=1 Tax=Diversispora epigaea TaxID=1348612 RepID=A0A397JSK9_9GLOM|nr:hypothetical protein Glove_9g341 [Diversispora epigaea]
MPRETRTPRGTRTLRGTRTPKGTRTLRGTREKTTRRTSPSTRTRSRRNSPPRSRGPKSPHPRRTREAKIRIRNYEEQQEQRRQRRQQTLPILQRFIPSTPSTRFLHRRNRPLTVAGPSITQPIVHPTSRARGEPVQHIILISEKDKQVLST